MCFFKSDGVWNTSFPEASKAFSAGKVSMIFVPTWNLLDIVRANPGMNIGVAPVPQLLLKTPFLGEVFGCTLFQNHLLIKKSMEIYKFHFSR
jgi:maltose-binding protein MalE